MRVGGRFFLCHVPCCNVPCMRIANPTIHVCGIPSQKKRQRCAHIKQSTSDTPLVLVYYIVSLIGNGELQSLSCAGSTICAGSVSLAA